MPVNLSNNPLAAGAILTDEIWNTLLEEVSDYLTGIDTTRLAARAGIVAEQISDRFVCSLIPIFTLPPLGAAGTLSDLRTGPSGFIMPNTTISPGTERFRNHIMLPLGVATKLIGIVGMASYVLGNPTVWTTINGTLLGGSGMVFNAANTAYFIANSVNPTATELSRLQNNTYFTFGLGHNGTNPSELGGLSMLALYAQELNGG